TVINVGVASLMISYHWLQAEQLATMFWLHVVMSLIGGPSAVLLWSMYADVVDYSEWKTGRRAAGLVFSAATLSQKLGASIGVATAGLLLGLFDYAPPVDGVDVAQSSRTLDGLRYMMGLIPAGLIFASVVCLSFYSIDRAKLNQITDDLAERRRGGDSR
ncbi:MAG: MFS transporter, partial [Planctomycetota bacterium]